MTFQAYCIPFAGCGVIFVVLLCAYSNMKQERPRTLIYKALWVVAAAGVVGMAIMLYGAIVTS